VVSSVSADRQGFFLAKFRLKEVRMPVASVKDFTELPAFLTKEQVMSLLGISLRKVDELVRRPGFPAMRLGERTFRISRDGLLRWLEGQDGSGDVA
jgi:excisionase family DNA binding protein